MMCRSAAVVCKYLLGVCLLSSVSAAHLTIGLLRPVLACNRAPLLLHQHHHHQHYCYYYCNKRILLAFILSAASRFCKKNRIERMNEREDYMQITKHLVRRIVEAACKYVASQANINICLCVCINSRASICIIKMRLIRYRAYCQSI